MTFDKTKVVPPEYARVLDANIKFHYLDESGTTLQTIDDSDFNIIISNNQKIIVKKKRKEDKPTDVLFGSGSLLADVYGDDDDSDVWDDATLMDNQRFKKLCRLPQLGVYVDEAHHLFGANLEKELRLGGANKTIVLLLRKSRKAFMPTHIALIQSQRRNASYSIFQVKRSKKYTLRVCLRPIREIYLFSIMIQNQNVLGSIIRISWLR